MGQGMRMALKGQTPSARARLNYITRQGEYAQGIDGPRTDLAATGSGNMPNWAGDADQFWHAVDQFERANARRCVELELNLPPELATDQQRQVVEAYAERLLGAERMPYTWAIHDGGGKNPHCHLMFQERGLDGIDRPDGQAWFKRANSKQPELGGAKKSRSVTGAAWTMHARATWAATVNDGLRAAGHEPRFDHRTKAAQRDEALRTGDLRRAAALGTLTEKHEGATIHGMRRRVERGDVEIDDLPEFARTLIEQNDRARAYNNALRDWARTAPEAELRERLAEDLDELREQLAQESPGAHVAAWMGEQQRLAQGEDQRRDASAAMAAGDLELRTAAQIEAAPMQARARIEQLRARVGAPEPVVIAEVLAAKKAAEKLDADAQAWRAAHPVRAWFAGKETAAERAAREARAAYMASPKLAEAKAAQAERTRDRNELAALEKQLPELERAAGIEPQCDQDERSKAMLTLAASDLRKADGWMQNHAQRCPYELREALHAQRRQIEHDRRQIEQLMQSPPAPELAAQIRELAAERLGSAKGWREVQDTAQAAAQAAQLREREQLRHQSSDAPEPRPRGPRGPGL